MMTRDELERLQKEADKVDPFQTKTKVFELGWRAHKDYIDSTETMRTLKESAFHRDLQIIIVCAKQVSNALTTSELYIARERLRKVMEYFEMP